MPWISERVRPTCFRAKGARSRKRTPFGGDTEVTLATALGAVSQKTSRFSWKLVDVTGIEPVTPCLQSRCSPS
jgi:hypothetical protein